MLQVQLLTVSDGKEDWLKSVQNLYAKKINYFCKFTIINVKPYRESREQNKDKIKKEGEALLKKIEAKDIVVVCDERGKPFSSIEFANKMDQRIEQAGSRRIVFVIGGAYGLSEQIKQRAQETIQLSTFVLNHHLAQAVLLEQIYRAFTIIKKIPYHNE